MATKHHGIQKTWAPPNDVKLQEPQLQNTQNEPFWKTWMTAQTMSNPFRKVMNHGESMRISRRFVSGPATEEPGCVQLFGYRLKNYGIFIQFIHEYT